MAVREKADKTCDKCENCSHREKMRPEKEYKELMNRLKRIEGQIRGIEGMLEHNAYCPDILIQCSAVSSALNSFNKVLLADHIRTCVVQQIREGDDQTIDELLNILQKLMK
jgi:DNA-binding FrmR family transcriptional regulator